MMGLLTAQGTRQMKRLADEELEKAVAHGTELLETNPEHAAAAALVYDGFVTLKDGKTDALIVQVRDYGRGGSLTIVVPYRPASGKGGFAVYRPKFKVYKGPDTDLNSVGQRFFAGVDQHDKGAAV